MENFLIFFLCFVVTVSASKYCDMKCFGKGHIGCNNDGNFAKKCKPGIKMLSLTDAQHDVVVNAHNDKRNIVAGGTDAKNSSVCRMATMQWDQELADLAVLNIKLCTWDHDECHSTDKFKYAGQNLAEKWISPPREYNTDELLLFAVNGWFNETHDMKPSYIDAFPGSPPKMIGHYTVMMSDYNTHVGCAAATFNDTTTNRQYYEVTCNYARNNVLGYPTYFRCPKAASSCKTGTNPQYPNLCSTSEDYTVNNWSKCEACKINF